MRSVLVLTTLLVGLAVPISSSPASLTGPQCGGIVTTDVALTEDMTCAGDGLVLRGAEHITVDLNGHTISGSGTGFGIDVQGVEGGATIENGDVRNFDVGIRLSDESPGSIQLEGLLIRSNGDGVVDYFSRDAVLSDSTIASNRSDGVRIGLLAQFRVINDHVSNNGDDGIYSFEDALRLIQNSFIAHNGKNGASLSSTVAVIVGNTFLGNGATGLSIFDRGCASFFAKYLVSDNFANQNEGGGMSMQGPGCVSQPSPPGSGNAAQNNDLFDCVLIICAKNPGQAKKGVAYSVAELPVHDR